MRKIIFLAGAFLVVIATVAATNTDTKAGGSAISDILDEYLSVLGEQTALEDRYDLIQANIDTLTCDLNKIDSEMRVMHDSIRTLMNQCAEYLPKARKIRKSSPDIDIVSRTKTVFNSIRRNGYLNADIYRLCFMLREMNQDLFAKQAEAERIKMLIAHEAELYAMLDDVDSRLVTHESLAKELAAELRRHAAETDAEIEHRNTQTRNLDVAITSSIKDSKEKSKGKSGDNASDFSSLRGRLLFPVSGKYNIVGYFGKNELPDYPKVVFDNPGINIEVSNSSKARAVYKGTVSSVWNLGTYHYVVMVRHGDYYTIYANLSKPSVKTGEKVKEGQVLGTVSPDTGTSGHSMLHFEVRKGTQKLNPLDWLKH